MPDLHLTVKGAARIVGGSLKGDGDGSISKVVTDSREDVKGSLYVALRGERFDGHSFLRDVAHAGALAALVEAPLDTLRIPQIVVKDTLAALQKLAADRRRRFSGPVVGVTGSSGKTTTRKLISSILVQKYAVHQPVKNFNNHIGVPLTLLNLNDSHQVAVLELGCSDFGEIKALTKLTKPDYSLVTNVGPAHLEKLKDLDGVARAKGELFLYSEKGAVALVNADDPRVLSMPVNTSTKVTYGEGKGVDVRLLRRTNNGTDGQQLVFEIDGQELCAQLPLLGAHNAKNALAAVAVAVVLGVEKERILRGLSDANTGSGRLAVFKRADGVVIIDDSYNANPDSMKAALEVLAETRTGGRAIAVLGDMLELGDASDSAHHEIGKYVTDLNIDILITIGEQSRIVDSAAAESGLPPDRRMRPSDHDRAAVLVGELAEQNDTVLVKGSRGMEMERIVSQLKKVKDRAI